MKKNFKMVLTEKVQKQNLQANPLSTAKKKNLKPMKATLRPQDAVNAQNRANDLLTEAMKQPGVKSIMEVFEASEIYHRQLRECANYLDWRHYPSSFSSCETTQLA